MPTPLPALQNSVNALRSSVNGLAELVGSLDADTLTQPAYPTEWTIADTLSHLGSGAVIMKSALERALAGEAIPDDFMPGVWDEWNAKEPTEQAADLVGADAALMDAIEAVSDTDAARVRIVIGNLDIDFATFVQHRLDEHVVHTWDVAVALDPTVTLAGGLAHGLSDDVVSALLDGLGWAAEEGGRPIPEERTLVIHTFDPSRILRLELGPDAVILEPEPQPSADLEELHLPGEALIRLVYGRLDPDHTPHGVGGSADLDELRRIFPGF